MKQRVKLVAPDAGLLSAIILLLILGVLLVYDTTYAWLGDLRKDQNVWYMVRKQAMAGGVGLIFMYVGSRLSFRFLRKWYKTLLYISAVLLVAVLVPGIGRRVGGGQSYFRFGDTGLQPSEMVKLALVLFLAVCLSKPKIFARRWPRTWVVPLAVSAGLVGLIAIERDLGTAALVIGICFSMFYAAGARKRYVTSMGACVLALAALSMMVLPHCRVRWVAYTQPWETRFGDGYQTVHSLIALGTGGVIGQGFCEGREKLYTPAAHTDYIFFTCGEELGLVGSLALLALFGFVVFRGLDIARRSKSAYGNLLAVGLTTMIGFQAIINIAVVTNSIPATGIPLPFISYGGTSLVAMMFAAGLLLSVSRQVNVELEERDPYEDSSDRRRNRGTHIPRNKYRSGGTRGRSRF